MPLRPKEFHGADPAFLPAFASFLRRNPSLWRVRRLDRFRPHDIYLAHHEVTFQGRIDAGLLRRFLQTDGADLQLLDWHAQNGDQLTACIPSVRWPKRPLLHFAARSDGNRAAPMLSRMEGARVTGLHLLAILLGGTPVGELDVVSATTALSNVAYQNPYALPRRIALRHDDHAAGPLPPEELLAWVESEGDWFADKLGARLREAVAGFVREEAGPGLLPPLRSGSGFSYPDLLSLTLHGIRYLLRLLVERTPAWVVGPPAGEQLTRESLIARPDVLAAQVAQVLETIEKVGELLDEAGELARFELLREIDSWTAYVMSEIRLGIPFNLKFSQLLPLPRGAGFRQRVSWIWESGHTYPIAFKDAQAVHLEIDVPHPELRVGHKPLVWMRIGGSGTVLSADPTVLFGDVTSAADRFLHLYSSRTQEEARQIDRLNPDFFLEIRLHLTRIAFWGHFLTAAALSVAVTFLLWAFIPAIATSRGPRFPAAVATVGTVTVSVILWLLTARGDQPLTRRKLDVARTALFVFVIAIVGIAAAYVVARFLVWLGWIEGGGRAPAGPVPV